MVVPAAAAAASALLNPVVGDARGELSDTDELVSDQSELVALDVLDDELAAVARLDWLSERIIADGLATPPRAAGGLADGPLRP